MKKILHISTSDFGGAGSAAYRLHNNLRKHGENSTLLVMKKTIDDNSIRDTSFSKYSSFFFRIINKLESTFNLFDNKYYFFDKHRNYITNLDQIEKTIDFNPDVIVLHWISTFIDLEIILELQQKYKAKVYWLLLDMAPMTGGCHFAWDCQGYFTDCTECPAVQWPYTKLPSNILEHKKNILKKMDIELLSYTKWIKNQLLDSTLFKNKAIHDFALGIDETLFQPLSEKEKNQLKKHYFIQPDMKVIFFGAASTVEERKGFSYLLQALEILSEDISFNKENITIVTAGNTLDNSIFQNIKMNHKHIGYLRGDSELIKAYQIADIFVSPSIEDSGPMMINESIMCGTPVVSFRMGIALDLVITGETGYLAQLKDTDDLAKGIKTIVNLSDSELNQMKINCRELALEKISENKQIKDFIKIIKGEI